MRACSPIGEPRLSHPLPLEEEHHDCIASLRSVRGRGPRGLRARLLQARCVTSREGAAPIKVDVVEKADAFVVKAEVPGVKKDDIQVTIEGNQVTISAEVKRESEQKDGERVAAQRALLRCGVSQLRAAGGHRREREPGEVRRRRARADAGQATRAAGAKADDSVRRFSVNGARACSARGACLSYALRRVLFLDVVAEEAPRRRRRREATPDLGRDRRHTRTCPAVSSTTSFFSRSS